MAQTVVFTAAIAAITYLESLALGRGIDGVAFATAIAAIAGIAGYHVHRIKL